MNIDGLGPSIVENLINNKLIANVVDLYHLTVDQLVTMDRMGKKSAENLVKAIGDLNLVVWTAYYMVLVFV